MRSGVDARTAMDLARHSDSRMTLGVYAEPNHRAAIAIIDRTFGRSAGDTLYDPPVTQNGQKRSHQVTLMSDPDSLSKCFSNSILTESGREDLNLRPLAPHASALARLRYAPNELNNKGKLTCCQYQWKHAKSRFILVSGKSGAVTFATRNEPEPFTRLAYI